MFSSRKINSKSTFLTFGVSAILIIAVIQMVIAIGNVQQYNESVQTISPQTNIVTPTVTTIVSTPPIQPTSQVTKIIETQPPPSNPQVSASQYIDPIYKFSFEYPDTWQKYQSVSGYGSVLTLIKTRNDNNAGTFSVEVITSPYSTNLETLLTKHVSDLIREKEITTTKHNAQVELDGVKAYRIDFKYGDTYCTQILAIYNWNEYILSYEGKHARYDEDLGAIQQLYRTFKFNSGTTEQFVRTTPVSIITYYYPTNYPTTQTIVNPGSPIQRVFPYTLNGNNNQINFGVYPVIAQSLASQHIPYYGDDTVYYQAYLSNDLQNSYLHPLADQIRSISSDPDDEARIAISLVQHIPYDYAKSYQVYGVTRYPYQVLSDNSGVCGEKSLLLAYLLKELGFGVVLFQFDAENHMAVGIAVDSKYGSYGTNYAFVESTTPSIITDNQGDYVGVGKLQSNPTIIPISTGRVFSRAEGEYNDAVTWNNIQSMGQTLDPFHYAQYKLICSNYGMSC